MPLGMIPQAVDEHVAAGFHSPPGKLSRDVLDIADGLAVRVEQSLGPQAELGVRLQPALLLPAARMGGAPDAAAGQRIESRCIDIDQARLTRTVKRHMRQDITGGGTGPPRR